ncbi:hypothetical protein M2G36_22070 [Vibrio vulnificus]|nr:MULTISPECIES: hypothetical protein [Vibrio]MCU8225462.1 hypothetical protein [Vibrio vulnificus]MCU8229740.1 hypothetical protein [Vibrio vulnificus]MCU8241353.1 hypothetical protein [Vibrio vulnificus]MCU8339543.1 hypothetical protein [Vibrio vulnificus]MCU8378323.1 hypothetical protein [Vibrio vulnificus]
MKVVCRNLVYAAFTP